MEREYVTLEDWKRLNPPRDHDPTPKELAEQRKRRYEVICWHFDQIVSKQTEWEPNDERPSEIR